MTTNNTECVTTTGLIFPAQAKTNIDTILRQIGKSTRSVQSRLRSIESDAEFVSNIASQLRFPLIANERCGSWYVRPELKAASAYFKSTDGHFGQWNMSLRRLNLQVLDVVCESGGCIIVDSTRRGKPLPDALSKTVPIWCAVMNRLLFPEAQKSHLVDQLPEVISESEYSSIEGRMDEFVHQVKASGNCFVSISFGADPNEALDLDIPRLRKKAKKPMKIIWIARSLDLAPPTILPLEIESGERVPIFLCMASIVRPTMSLSLGFEYIQGAGDDSEVWSHGLTPTIFWSHREQIFCTSESEFPDFVKTLIDKHLESQLPPRFVAVTPGSWILVGTMCEISQAQVQDSFVITCSLQQEFVPRAKIIPRRLHLNCGPGKLGSRNLRQELNKIPDFVQGKQIEKMFVCCPSGMDISVGVALALLVLYTDEQGRFSQSPLDGKVVDKALIRKKWSWIAASMPSARPSRATLNAVNSFLMGRPK